MLCALGEKARRASQKVTSQAPELFLIDFDDLCNDRKYPSRHSKMELGADEVSLSLAFSIVVKKMKFIIHFGASLHISLG